MGFVSIWFRSHANVMQACSEGGAIRLYVCMWGELCIELFEQFSLIRALGGNGVYFSTHFSATQWHLFLCLRHLRLFWNREQKLGGGGGGGGEGEGPGAGPWNASRMASQYTLSKAIQLFGSGALSIVQEAANTPTERPLPDASDTGRLISSGPGPYGVPRA